MKKIFCLVLFMMSSSSYSNIIIPIDNNLDSSNILEIENEYNNLIKSVISESFESGISIKLNDKIITSLYDGYRVTFPDVQIFLTREMINKNKSKLKRLKLKTIANKSIFNITQNEKGYYFKEQGSGYCFAATLLDKNNKPIKSTKYYHPSSKLISIYDMAPPNLNEDYMKFFFRDSILQGDKDILLAKYTDEVNFKVSSTELANIGGLSLSMEKKAITNCWDTAD